MAQGLDLVVWLWAPTSIAYTLCLPHGLNPQSLGHFCQDHKEEALRPLQTLSCFQYPPPPLMCNPGQLPDPALSHTSEPLLTLFHPLECLPPFFHLTIPPFPT